MHPKFKVEFLEEARLFLNGLDEKAKRKILYNIRKAQSVKDGALFKKLNNHVWEFRTIYKKTCYRLFAFWDKSEKTNILVISTHGIEKKSDKIPAKEIAKTEQLMKQYFDLKG